MTEPKNKHPVTEQDIEENFDQASEDEFKQFQLEENARMEADWLARQETPFADRALDEVPDDEDFDDLAPKSDAYSLVGGGYAIVSSQDDPDEPLGLTLSRLNPHGVFTPDGQQIGSTCRCEDYPCCGH